MDSKQEFLRRKFWFDLQGLFALATVIGLWFLVVVIDVLICDRFHISPDADFEKFGGAFLATTPFFAFGLYKLVCYIWTKRLTDKYGISLYGDLDQDWLKKEQGYDAKIFEEIYSKHLYFCELGAKTLFITIPLFFLPWLWLSISIDILVYLTYCLYKETFFHDAMADRWPRIYGSGIVISRILNQDTEPNESERKDDDGK